MHSKVPRGEPLPMNHKRLDISGTTGPYCLSVVEKEAKTLCRAGELLITCDNFPAVTTLIPRIARNAGLSCELRRAGGDLFRGPAGTRVNIRKGAVSP